MLDPLLAELSNIGMEFWSFGIGFLIILVSLFMLYRTIQGSAAMGMGSGQFAGPAILGIVGLLLIVLGAFKVIPSFVALINSSAPPPPWQPPL